MEIEKQMHNPAVGMMSCVGILGPRNYPIEFGNYCSIRNGPYLCNLWAENMEEWARRNPGEQIEVTVVRDDGRSVGYVSDERLKDWCHKRLCVTSNGWPSEAVARYVHEQASDMTYDERREKDRASGFYREMKFIEWMGGKKC